MCPCSKGRLSLRDFRVARNCAPSSRYHAFNFSTNQWHCCTSPLLIPHFHFIRYTVTAYPLLPTPPSRQPPPPPPPPPTPPLFSTDVMGSKPKISTATASVRRMRRKSSYSSRRLSKLPEFRHRVGGGASVSDKLEALKSLIPSEKAELKPDQLFQETADYIVLLKTQVFVLQKLIDFYGSQPQENPNAV
ncbi:hypothetical protein Salat_1390400 [Sesamum alatum]|uniref:BHLH domain-containing protein n=1 Tax=Sesamum alatum TaxID=300844 RepID=A0AAE1Y9K4_9LAMI|nr:hypothetical protein Salat_1390400 [Sesamum alatum]